jgi:transposase
MTCAKKLFKRSLFDGMKKSEAAIAFQISRNTIDLWLKRREEIGDYRAKPNQPPGNGHKITDWEKFRAFAQTHGEKTQAEMAALWDGEISARSISRALQKIGFTGKKRPMATASNQEPKGKNSSVR